ncbi:MAG: DUF2225 domain-containing protein, partial [Defluviitaleaceae bacterium]|nr:DUF2225 domain-containing protein [Defluviitaleaceae bacterium]
MINVDELKNMSSVMRFGAGSVILREGETDDAQSMYVVLQGRVDVIKNFGKNNENRLATIGPGDFFGEMSLFLGSGRTATVVAADETAALRIDRGNAYAFFENQPQATFTLIRTLCARLEALGVKAAGPSGCAAGDTSTIHAPGAGAIKNDIKKPEDAKAETPQAPAKNADSPLFIEGHKLHDEKYGSAPENLLLDKKFQCPVCVNSFVKKIPRPSALRLQQTDPDLRAHYKDVEILHYEIITCPYCLLSAFAAQFEKAAANKEKQLHEVMNRYAGAFDFSGAAPKDLKTLLAGYYFADLCAPVCYRNPGLVSARVWHRIAWLYGDFGDQVTAKKAEIKALALYVESYHKLDLPADQLQRMELIIGELY